MNEIEKLKLRAFDIGRQADLAQRGLQNLHQQYTALMQQIAKLEEAESKKLEPKKEKAKK